MSQTLSKLTVSSLKKCVINVLQCLTHVKENRRSHSSKGSDDDGGRGGSQFWGHVSMAPPDSILGLKIAFTNDQNKSKVNLGMGVYKDDEGEPFILPSVCMAKEVLNKKGLNHEYGPVTGDPEFCKVAVRLALGKDSCTIKENCYCTLQTLSGTGALRVGFEFCSLHFKQNKKVYVCDLTWPNHFAIISTCGLRWKTYRYYNQKKKNFDFENAMKDICEIPCGSIILFHACAHNPTGVDPTKEQWQQISKVVKSRQLLPFFDMAYQGFATGNVDEDAYAIRLFIENGHQVMVAQSFAKNMGLYGERIGALTCVCGNKDVAARVLSQMNLVARKMYSSPPLYGQRIVTTVLSQSEIRKQWDSDVTHMVNRVINMRKLLRKNLEEVGSKLNWRHITDQVGMFCYTGLTPDQVKIMVKDYHIYMTDSGRISVAGITSKNVKYIANAMHKATTRIK